VSALTAPRGARLLADEPVDARRAALLPLVCFAALGLFGAAHWVSFVQGPPVGRTILAVLVATGGAALLLLLGSGSARGVPRAAIVPAALVCAVATIALGLVAIGLPARLLLPNHWSELFDGLDQGMAGVQTVEWPYDGVDEWVRLTVLMGAPFLLGLAASLVFFPARRAAGGLRIAGLVVLLVLYGVPVTEHDPGAPLLRGLVLLALVAAWLWLPRLAAREAAAGAALVLSLGVLSMPVAAALDGNQRWWDYGAIDWFGSDKVVSFDWNHRYGPLDWPRDGTTLLSVQSSQPHYWKVEALDDFDGLRWVRGSGEDASAQVQGLPFRRGQTGKPWDYFQWNPKWNHQIRFTIRALSSDLLVSAGTAYSIEGAGFAVTAADGTIHTAGGPLHKGDAYEVETYIPDPTPNQMRGSPLGLPATLLQYTSIQLPGPHESALDPKASPRGHEQVIVPLWGSTDFGDPAAPGRAIEGSAYGRMYGVATALTAGAPTMYDAVNRIERYLDHNYTYSEKPGRARYPLNAFLFRDKFGYCQQFSGAMALMLRMVGIPARVVGGFAPGSYNRDSGEYRVRDLDAHSWVEVYFNGIGWVTFDPTPAASPAQTQSADLLPTSSGAAALNGTRAGTTAPGRGADGSTAPTSHSGGGLSPWLLLPLALLLLGALAMARLVWRTRRLSPAELADAQLAELRRALATLGWTMPAGTTLLGLERRLDRAAGPASARYAAGLRAHRYDPRAPGAPSLRDRRALRRELTSRGGRLRGLFAIPPGGPRPV
jgi:transglutaminase-like putative cysteine protease